MVHSRLGCVEFSFMPASSWITILVLAIGALLSLSEVWKDWNERGSRKKTFRSIKIGLTFVAFLVGAILVVRTSKESSKAESDSKLQIQGLQSTVSTEIANNDRQYTRNQAELHGLRDELSELKTETATVELRRKITTLEAKIDKSLIPVAKASLVFSFFPFSVASDGSSKAVTDAVRPIAADGTAHLDVDVGKLTEVDAVDGEIILSVCDACKLVKMPDGFVREAGQSEQIINMPFARVLAKSVLPRISLDLIVPLNQYEEMPIGMTYRCRTCVIEPAALSILARLHRDTVQMPPNLHAPAKPKH
jgi:hypothetical protein